jgi:hypothetical protein
MDPQTIAVRITTDAAGANETVKGYKAQLREATAELVLVEATVLC